MDSKRASRPFYFDKLDLRAIDGPKLWPFKNVSHKLIMC